MRKLRKFVGFIVVLFLLFLGLLGWFGYQSFTTGFSAKAEPHWMEVFLARQLRYLAIPMENRNLRNPVPLSPEVSPGPLCRSLCRLPCH